MAKKPSKSETLTIRLDPKTRFMLDFVARLRGQSITTVVERAISEAANRATIEDELDFGNRGATRIKTWRDFWSVYEGERALRIVLEDDLHPTFEEERRYAFAKEHWPFFWTTPDRGKVVQHYLEVLWPRIDEFVEMHNERKASDYFAAGKAMQIALFDAKLKAPEWPAKATPKTSQELPDEIPF